MNLHPLMGCVFAVSLVAACGEPVQFPPPTPADAGPDASADVSMADAAPADRAEAGPPLVDSGCPAPATITPMDTPRGYLMPINSRLVRVTDGDTAHFTVPVLGEATIRMLFVNTEESHGAETTAFGTMTAAVVERYLREGRTFTVVPREDTSNRGQVDLDPYMRWLALVYMDGELFQVRLVREGLSAYYTQFGCAPEPLHSALLWAEAEARANQRGIWRPGHPTDYREVLRRWIGTSRCRPNPYLAPYCR